MSESLTRSVATPDVIKDAEPTPVANGVSHAPVLITEHEVRFSTAAAVPLRPSKITHRLIEAIRVVSAALHPPPARLHYPQRFSYLERALMAREMDRL